MDIKGFLELGDYHVSMYAEEEPTGRWKAWALFERSRDFHEMKTHIPGMRRRIPNDFRSQEKAIEAAYEYAHKLVATGEVGL